MISNIGRQLMGNIENSQAAQIVLIFKHVIWIYEYDARMAQLRYFIRSTERPSWQGRLLRSLKTIKLTMDCCRFLRSYARILAEEKCFRFDEKTCSRACDKMGVSNSCKTCSFSTIPGCCSWRANKVGKITLETSYMRHAPQLWRHRSAILQQELFGITFPTLWGCLLDLTRISSLSQRWSASAFSSLIGGSVTALPCDEIHIHGFIGFQRRALWWYTLGYLLGIRRIIANLRQYPKSILHDFPLSV